MTGGPVLLAQLLAKNKPALAGHHEIEQDEVEAPNRNRVHHFAPIGRLRHPEAMIAQVLAHKGAQLTIVIDNQNVTGRACVQERAPTEQILRRSLSEADAEGARRNL